MPGVTRSGEYTEAARLSVSVFPENVTDPGVVYTSADPAVAEVLSDGTVQAIGPGTTVVTARSADGGAQESCTVTVTYTVWQWIRHYILFGWVKDR